MKRWLVAVLVLGLVYTVSCQDDDPPKVEHHGDPTAEPPTIEHHDGDEGVEHHAEPDGEPDSEPTGEPEGEGEGEGGDTQTDDDSGSATTVAVGVLSVFSLVLHPLFV